MIKDLLKDLINPLADRLGIYDMLLANLVYTRPGWTILMYHRVVPDVSADPFRMGMCVHAKRFRDHMKFVKGHFTVISVADVIERMAQGRPLPDNALSITFDDAYQDFADHALPVLRQYGFPSTVYAVTGSSGDDEEFWWDRLIRAFARTRRQQLSLEFLGNPAGPAGLSLKHGSRRKHALTETLNWLWQQPPASINRLVAQLVAALESEADGKFSVASASMSPVRRMSLDLLARMDSEEVDIEAHSMTHPNLALLDPNQALQEMRSSRRVLENVCNRPITGFAYPAGFRNETTGKLAEEAGFTYAVGTNRGINRLPFDLFNLQRIGMPDTNVADIKRCLGSVASRTTVTLPGKLHSQ